MSGQGRARGLSRRALALVDTDQTQGRETLPDKRQIDMAPLIHLDETLLGTLNEVFAGTGLMEDQRKVRLLVKLRGRVGEQWNATRDAFLEIGRALNEVDAVLDEAEREGLKRGFRRLFPFSETVASQFRVIARAVDDGRILKELLPGSYGTAYQMALLNREQRVLAEKRGLLRPSVSRNALIEFRRLNEGLAPSGTRGPDPTRMKAELTRLRRSEEKMAKVMAATRARIEAIEALLRMGDDD